MVLSPGAGGTRAARRDLRDVPERSEPRPSGDGKREWQPSPLHAIHLRLKQQGRGGPASRFEIVKVLAPAPGVALAQIRRVAIGPDGQPVEPSSDLTGPFSEMVLYVLVRRGGTWWVAAGQNTPIQPPPS